MSIYTIIMSYVTTLVEGNYYLCMAHAYGAHIIRKTSSPTWNATGCHALLKVFSKHLNYYFNSRSHADQIYTIVQVVVSDQFTCKNMSYESTEAEQKHCLREVPSKNSFT